MHYVPKFSRSSWGGAESAIVNLSESLRRAGYEPEVWTTNSFGDAPREEVEGLVVRRFEGRFFSRREAAMAGLGKAAFSLPMLRALLFERAPDILHVHTHNRLASALVMAARTRRVPVAVTLHSEFREHRPRWLYWFPNEAAIRFADAVISVNRAIAGELARAGIRSEGVVSIPNGVDPRRFAHGDGRRFRSEHGLGDAPVVLTPGRVCDVKNQRVAVDVVPRLAESGVDARWVIVGTPSEPWYFESLKVAVARPELAARVVLVPGLPPESPELADAYASADVVVVPSKHEAFGLVVLEAWCAGKPVVATRVGGLPELIEDGVSGRLVPPGDVTAIADAVAGLLRDAGERKRLAATGAARASEFAWGNVGSRTVSVYDRIARPA